MPPDSPNPVEAWPACVCEVHGLLHRTQTHLGFLEPVGGRLECNFCAPTKPPRFVRETKVVSEADFQAEVEKREEVEGEHCTLLNELERLVPEWTVDSGLTPIAAISQLLVDKEEAQRLVIARKRIIEEVEDELERRQERADVVIAQGKAPGWFHGNSFGLGEALVLLRDKGTGMEDFSERPEPGDKSPITAQRDKGSEQGGACEHGNTFDCPDCRLDVLELLDDVDDQGGEGYDTLVSQETLILEVTEAICEAMEPDQQDASGHVTRKELAERLGKSKGYVSQILNGERNMTLRTLADFAGALDRRVTIRLEPIPGPPDEKTEERDDH